jgi:hypothetical protein
MTIQTVIEYDLAKFHDTPKYYNFYEAERQLMDSFAGLEAGSMVRLRVHGYSPFKDYLGFTMRPDIILQIIANDPAVAREWRNVFEPPEEILEY